MEVKLIQTTPNPVESIARYASICYDSDPKNPQKLVDRLYENGHHSVFEHITFTFRIDGVSRALSHQLVRHRMASYTQRSQRYCAEDEQDNYVTPPSIATDEDALPVYRKALKACQDAYDELVNLHNIPREDARYILPNARTTSLYMTMNLRELMHFCNERMCSRAQWEIRMLTTLMTEQVDPALRKYLVPKCESGWRVCKNPCGRRMVKLYTQNTQDAVGQKA